MKKKNQRMGGGIAKCEEIGLSENSGENGSKNVQPLE